MVIQYSNDQWAQTIQNLGSILGKTLGSRRKAQQEQGFLNQLLGSSPSSPTVQNGMEKEGIKETFTSPAGSTSISEVAEERPTPNIQKLNETQLDMVERQFPQFKTFVDSERKRRETSEKRFLEDRKFHAKGAEKSSEKVNAMAEAIPKKELALQMAEEAIASGKTGPLSVANIAKRLNIPELKGLKGAQLEQASKEFLLSNLSRVSARAQNLWMEKRIASLFAEIGDPQLVAQQKQVLFDTELGMDKAFVQAFNEISQNDLKKYGYVRNDAEQRARQEIAPLEEDLLQKSAYKTRQIWEEDQGYNKLKKEINKAPPKGTYLTPFMAKILKEKYGSTEKAIENAKKLGYKIPTRAKAESWQ